MKQYRLAVRNALLFTRAALKHRHRMRVVTLLLDTGSTYTILSWEVLVSLQLDPATSLTRRLVMTASGLLMLPEVEVEEFHTLGQRVERFPILTHTVPLGSQVDGVVGMNFLRQFEMTLHFKQAIIQLES